jgi:2'-5' RNA ligase
MSVDYSYVSVKLKPEFVQALYDSLLGIGLPPSYKHEPHCTIMFDKREIEKGLCVLDPLKEFEAFVTSVGYLGKDDLVFNLTSRDMVDEFHRLTDAGYQHSYGTPLPHMTILYDSDKYEKLLVEQNMQEWVGRRLVFSQLSFGVKKVKTPV